MKTCHWTLFNKSGMNRVAESMVAAERALGHDAILANPQDAATYERSLDADVHISHTHFPDGLRARVTKPLRVVWVSHGTPEHVFQSAAEEGSRKSYGHADGWMLCQNWLRTADACVTFWPRHQAILQSLCDRGRVVHCVPLGVDKEFWKPQPTRGKFAGSPSVFTCENSHYMKWPLDLFIAWPWVYPHLKGEAKLHATYLPNDQHRWFFPLVNRNGCSYGSYISPLAFDHNDLRNAFCSVDYFIGLVRYGDFNRLCLEANACGEVPGRARLPSSPDIPGESASNIEHRTLNIEHRTLKTISYAGNPYSDFWVPEGDQRVIAAELIKILNGEVEPRAKTPVPDQRETSEAMVKIYEGIL